MFALEKMVVIAPIYSYKIHFQKALWQKREEKIKKLFGKKL